MKQENVIHVIFHLDKHQVLIYYMLPLQITEIPDEYPGSMPFEMVIFVGKKGVILSKSRSSALIIWSFMSVNK